MAVDNIARGAAQTAAGAAALKAPVNDARINSGSWVPLGKRPRSPYNTTGNYPSVIQSNGTNLGGTGRMSDVAQLSGAGALVGFPCFINSSGDSDNPYDVTISGASLTLSGALNLPLTFGGSRSVTIKGSNKVYWVFADPLGVSFLKGAQYWIQINVSVAGGAKYPMFISCRGSGYGEGLNYDPSIAGPGPDYSAYGQPWVAISPVNRMFGPGLVLTRPAKGCSVPVFITDSIGVGTGETTAVASDHWDDGMFARACENRWPHYIIGGSGTTMDDWVRSGQAKSFGGRQAMARIAFTHIVHERGINDILGGVDLPTWQTRAITNWRDLAVTARPVYQTTITPLTVTSTDSATTVAGQTVNASASVRVAVNAWLRDGAPLDKTTLAAAAVGATGANIVRAGYWTTSAGAAVPPTTPGAAAHPLTGVMEFADAVESARDSGKFKVAPGARKTTDAAMTSASAVLTSATAAFVAGDVGRQVLVNGAGASGTQLSTVIASYTSATQVTLAATASTTVSGATLCVSPFGYTADLIHLSGTNGPDPGGYEAAANFLLPQFTAIFGPQST